MKYNELILKKQDSARRSGRGISAGHGKTAGRGTKGQGSRKSATKTGFEGGQMPIYMRLPKLRGFTSHRASVETVYTGQIEMIKKSTIDNSALYDAGLISSPHVAVKLLVNGDLKSKKMVRLQSASNAAVIALEKSGSSFEKVSRLARQKTSTDIKPEK